VTGIVINDRDEILLKLRRDTDTWAPPSDGIEETGIEILPEAITAVLSGEDYNVTYPNGDQMATVPTVFRCRPLSAASPHVNDESQDIRHLPSDALPENMLPRHQ
jgi:8-oxo-dGTP pyrophosphatase MutT (NUDIX family)